jgi:hypothetical protein
MIFCCCCCFKKPGYGALYRGLSPTLVGVAPYNGLKFAAYDGLLFVLIFILVYNNNNNNTLF